MEEKVQSIDTYILRISCFLFLLFFFLGISIPKISLSVFNEIDSFLSSLFGILIGMLVFIVLLPTFWLICLRKCSLLTVVEKLRKSEYKRCPIPNDILKFCPKCGDKKILMIKNKVISEDEGRKIYYCEECNFMLECPVKLNIAY
jgi:hypothetical protein